MNLTPDDTHRLVRQIPFVSVADVSTRLQAIEEQLNRFAETDEYPVLEEASERLAALRDEMAAAFGPLLAGNLVSLNLSTVSAVRADEMLAGLADLRRLAEMLRRGPLFLREWEAPHAATALRHAVQYARDAAGHICQLEHLKQAG